MCPSCQLVSGWSSVEKFLTRTPKLTKELEKSKEIFINSKPKITSTIVPANAKCLSTLDSEVVIKVMDSLGLNAIPHSVLSNFSVLCDTQSNDLYFPLKDVNGAVVGYRRLYKIEDVIAEETIPETESFGVVKSQPLKKESTNAVLVLSIVDMLALATQKINCKLKILLFTIRFLISNLRIVSTTSSNHYDDFFLHLLRFNNLSSTWTETTTSTMSSRSGLLSKINHVV